MLNTFEPHVSELNPPNKIEAASQLWPASGQWSLLANAWYGTATAPFHAMGSVSWLLKIEEIIWRLLSLQLQKRKRRKKCKVFLGCEGNQYQFPCLNPIHTSLLTKLNSNGVAEAPFILLHIALIILLLLLRVVFTSIIPGAEVKGKSAEERRIMTWIIYGQRLNAVIVSLARAQPAKIRAARLAPRLGIFRGDLGQRRGA